MPVFCLFYLDTVAQILLSQLSFYSYCPGIDSYSTWIESRLSIQTLSQRQTDLLSQVYKYMEIKQYSNITFKINISAWLTSLANALLCCLHLRKFNRPTYSMSLHIFTDYNDGHATSNHHVIRPLNSLVELKTYSAFTLCVSGLLRFLWENIVKIWKQYWTTNSKKKNRFVFPFM